VARHTYATADARCPPRFTFSRHIRGISRNGTKVTANRRTCRARMFSGAIGTRGTPPQGGHRVNKELLRQPQLYPAFTELPIMSAWGEKAEESGRKKRKKREKSKHGAHLFSGSIGLPEHIFIKSRVISYWLVSRFTFHPVTASLATRCLMRELHAEYQNLLQNRGHSREIEKHNHESRGTRNHE
jgi:hypothetical protein